MKFKVTEKHIRKGAWSSTSNCPVALCIREKLGLICHYQIAVTCDYIMITKSDCKDRFIKKLPKSVIDCLADFDAGKEVKPFEFEIRIPR